MPATLRILVNDIIAKDGDINKAIEIFQQHSVKQSNTVMCLKICRASIIAGRLGLENSVMAMRLAR